MERGKKDRKGGCSIRFQVDEEGEGSGGRGGEDASFVIWRGHDGGLVRRGVREGGGSVCVVEDREEGFDVEGFEGAGRREGLAHVANEELVRGFRVGPDVGFDACAAGCKGVVEGHPPPVVVVRVAGDGLDVATEVSGPHGQSLLGRLGGQAPARCDQLNPVLGLRRATGDLKGEKGAGAVVH